MQRSRERSREAQRYAQAMPPASTARSDALAIGLSLGAAATSAYVLWKTTQEPKQAPKDKKSEKKLKQQARSRKIESLIMERGQAGTKDYRVHVLAKGEEDMTVAELSLWHDVPLVADNGLFNFVCEIPKCTRKKFEVATTEGRTPIKQDEKKGVLREFKKGDIFFNYGCFPRTWEDPRHVSPDTGYPGDNDPLDVCAFLRPPSAAAARRSSARSVAAVVNVAGAGAASAHGSAIASTASPPRERTAEPSRRCRIPRRRDRPPPGADGRDPTGQSIGCLGND